MHYLLNVLPDVKQSRTEISRIKGETKFWSRQAYKYDRWIKNAFNDQYDIFRAKFKSLVKPDDVILEIGTGTGDIAFNLAPLSKKVIGTDISSEMISEANRKLENKNLRNLTFKKADAYNLPFDDGMFDKVVCCNTLQTMKEPGRAIKEARRVLKDGGEFISITYCYGDSDIVELLKLVKFAMKRGKPRYWKNFSRKKLVNYFDNGAFKIIEREDILKKPVVLFLRCKKT
jgi:ubiquinone/menaquinone biosynthesis C-methylase UbiE